MHADEPIPPGSLAATGTRYQRHIKTSRARDAGRARAQSNPNPGTSRQSRPQVPPPPPPHDSGLLSRRDATRSLNRPGPITLPQNSGDIASAFENYRSNTPPESPASAVGTFSRVDRPFSYRDGPTPHLPRSLSATSNTPTSATFTGEHRSPIASPMIYNSPYGNSSTMGSPAPSFSPVSAIFPSRNAGHRRLSVPGPSNGNPFYQPSRMGPTPNVPLPSPNWGGNPYQYTRRESIDSAVDEAEDLAKRRRTWHSGYTTPLDRDIISPTTTTFANTSLSGGPSEYVASPTNQAAVTLPSISAIFGGSETPNPPPSTFGAASSYLARRATPRRTSIARPMTLHEGMTGRATHSFVRGHSRSASDTSTISTIDTRLGNLMVDRPSVMSGGGRGDYNSGPGIQWDASLSRKRSLERSVYIGDESSVRNGRKRQNSIGSGDSSGSEGVATPSTSPAEELNPGIVGEGSTDVDDHNMVSYCPFRDFLALDINPMSQRIQKAVMASRHTVASAQNRRHSMELGALLNSPPPPERERDGYDVFNTLVSVATAAGRMDEDVTPRNFRAAIGRQF